MSTVTPAEYVRALKAEGLQVTAHPGWAEKNRPGPWNPHGFAVHHTGPYSTVAQIIDLLRKGRSDLPGPLCHSGGRPSGVIDLVGWNDTNHAGLVDPAVLAALRADKAPPAPRAGKDTADGNAELYGLELYHPGNGKTPWPAEQVEAAVRWGAAICRLHDWSANSGVYHSGLTTRKPDPKAMLTITQYRARVTERLKHGAAWDKGDQPTPAPVTPKLATVRRVAVLYRTKNDPAAYALTGDTGLPGGSRLHHVTKSEADQLQAIGVQVSIVVVPADSPLWRLGRV